MSTPCMSVALKRTRKFYPCSYCGVDVDIEDRTHIMEQCEAIDEPPAAAGDIDAIAMRMAGATKIRKISDNAVPHSSGVT